MRKKRKKADGAGNVRRPGMKKVRVFMVDDNMLAILGMGELLSKSKDLEFVGSCQENMPDLPGLILKCRADVVWVDIRLGPLTDLRDIERDPRLNGCAAIVAIRKEGGEKIKILASSHHLDSWKPAMRAGADGFASPNDDICGAFMKVYRGIRVEPGLSVGMLRKIELRVRSQEVALIGVRGTSRPLRIEPGAYSLFYYLARERAAGGTEWVVREPRKENYEFREAHLWKSICESHGVTTPPGNQLISQWACAINKKARPFMEESIRLIRTPGEGRKETGKTSHYALIETLKAEDISFMEDDV